MKNMRLLIFLSLITSIFSACSSSQIEYNGNCLSSCTQVNKVYHPDLKQCVDLCKSYDYYRYQYKCISSCTAKKVINSNHLDNFCNVECMIFGQNYEANSNRCYKGCKNNGFQVHISNAYNCGSCKYNIYEEEPDETYCVNNCNVYGFYSYNKKCVKSCKIIGKYYYNGKCVDSCSNYKYLTDEENYCTQDCYYHNMIGAQGTCVDSCASVGQYFGYEHNCQQTTSSRTLVYKNENYAHKDCTLFGLLYGPSSNCVENCKQIGKVRYTNTCYDKCDYTNGVSQIYPYEYEDEIYCLSKDQCQNIGKYPIRKNGLYYCSDECTDSNCIIDCGIFSYYSVPDNQCVGSCREKGLYLYDIYCINSCPIFSKYIYNGQSEDLCLSQCPDDAPFADYSTNKCVESCNELPIFDNMCVNSCPQAAQYINDMDNNKYCVKNCNELGLYNIISQKLCTDNCKKNSKYLAEGNCFDKCISEYPSVYETEEENYCIKQCSDVGLLTDVSDGSCISNCKNAGKIKYEDRCINECPFNVKYTYSTNEENYCVKSCTTYGQVPNDLKCVESTCKSMGKTLINGICMACPEGVGFKIRGIDEDYCTPDCSEFGLIPNYQTNLCETINFSCESGKFKNYLTGTCVDKCPDEFNFIQDSGCVKQCEKFYYEDNNHNKICINSCTGNYPYMVINQKRCVSSCNEINNYQLYGYNICYSKCNEQSVIPRYNILTRNIFSTCIQNCINNDNTKNEQDCSNDCLLPFKFSDETNKQCYQSCDGITKFEYKNFRGNYLCVDKCKDVNRVRYGNICVSKCPSDMNIKYESNGDIICDDKCPNYLYMGYLTNTRQYTCIINCKDNGLFLDGNKCVDKCPTTKNYKIFKNNDIICSSSCDDVYKYISEENGDKFCVKNCKSEGKVLHNEKCLDYCPDEKSIERQKNDDIECSDECEEGKLISILNNKKSCVNDCSENNQFLYDGKCLSECPNGKYLYENSNSNKDCIDDCQTYNLYANDKKCVSNCEIYNKFVYQGKCISNCPEGKYLYENINTGKSLCIEDCNSNNLFLNGNKCVTDCKIFNKFAFEGKCLSECPEDYPYTSNGQCRKDPCEDGQFYDFFLDKCYDKCDTISNYLDTETNYCIKNCKNKISNKIFSIFENKCISNCNEQNKYIYLYNNEYYCLDNCEENNLLISSDGKFCIEQCDSSAPYIKNNKCSSSCGDLYIDLNKKCVEKCPFDYPYVYNNECVESCYDNSLYLIYNTNICIDKCSNNLVLNTDNKNWYYKKSYEKCLDIEGNTEETCNKPFYLKDKDNKICFQDCKQSVNTKYIFNDEECVGRCIYGIKEDNICNVNNNQNNNNEYQKCPESRNTNGNYLFMNYFIYFILFFIGFKNE